MKSSAIPQPNYEFSANRMTTSNLLQEDLGSIIRELEDIRKHMKSTKGSIKKYITGTSPK